MHIKLIIVAFFFSFFLGGNVVAQTTGKNPVIIIPGISGSKLVNPKTGRTVWFSVRRDKDDDLRLPMTSPVLSRNRDGLEAQDIIRSVEVLPVLPDIEVYQSLIDSLKERGFTEATWDKPQATDVFYVFPYDWRRDNVETAHLLMQRMSSVKRALKKPGLKFDIIAHSMGGLVARYAAMYGSSPLPTSRPVPNWSGASHINKLMMFGTPNEGSFDAMDVLLNGYPIIAGRRLPFIDDLKPEDVMTAPSIYQLVPHQSSARFLDADLNPLKIDIYNVESWIKYGWGAIGDPKFLSKLLDAPKLALTNKEIKPRRPGKTANREDHLVAQLTFARVKAFMASALNRARRFHQALGMPVKNAPVEMYAYGGNCKPTLDALVLIRDEKTNRWTTLVDARDIKNSSGLDVKKDTVRAAMFAEGDGRVTMRSLIVDGDLTTSDVLKQKRMPLKSSFLGCGSHTKLFLEKPIQDSFFSSLVVEQQQQP